MGLLLSKSHGDVHTRIIRRKPGLILDDMEDTESSRSIDQSRLIELMHGLQRVARLQQEVTNAQIDVRQKRREAGFKRQDVWMCDAEFMRYIQEFSTKGVLEGIDKLLHLAANCQEARNILGPVEQEGIEAEQRWEGQTWQLNQAEDRLYKEFKHEFRVFSSNPVEEISIASSRSSSSSEADDEQDQESYGTAESGGHPIALISGGSVASSSSLKFRHSSMELRGNIKAGTSTDLTFFGMDDPGSSPNAYEWHSDSGIGDIDQPIETTPDQDLVRSFQPLPRKEYDSIELYPELLTDFASTRDRVNQWLENTVLVSRFEAISLFTILKDQLDRENATLPSNWSQLVVAYWKLDGAASPHSREPKPLLSSHQGTPHFSNNACSEEEQSGGRRLETKHTTTTATHNLSHSSHVIPLHSSPLIEGLDKALDSSTSTLPATQVRTTFSSEQHDLGEEYEPP